MMNPQTATFWIETLGLLAHPEGGFFKETYRSSALIPKDALSDKFTGDRHASTAIYFLLRSQDRSVFHRIQSDEMWHFYDGGPLTIYMLDEGGLTTFKLGRNISAGELPQIVIPAGKWFGAKVEYEGGFTLAGCTVAPGFDFRDFEMAKRETLLKTFPAHRDIIEKLT
jgi:predicted cupin superfamily sugar epimerase